MAILDSAALTIYSEPARRYAARSRAASTLRAYRAAWAEFEHFAGEGGLPAAPRLVIDYLVRLADGGAKVSTIGVKACGISFRHTSAHCPDPTKDPDVRAVLAGIRRELGAPPVKKAALSLDELRRMVKTCDTSTLAGKRDKAILLLGWAGAFRRSELVALDVGDLDFCEGAVKVKLRRSKTDQEGAGLVKVIPQIGSKALDPVRAVKAWLDAARIAAGPVFRYLPFWGAVSPDRISGQSIALVVKRRAKLAGLDPKAFAGHSLRSGFITAAYKSDVQEWQIMEVSGHKSTRVLRGYNQDAGRGASAAVRAAFGG